MIGKDKFMQFEKIHEKNLWVCCTQAGILHIEQKEASFLILLRNCQNLKVHYEDLGSADTLEGAVVFACEWLTDYISDLTLSLQGIKNQIAQYNYRRHKWDDLLAGR